MPQPFAIKVKNTLRSGALLLGLALGIVGAGGTAAQTQQVVDVSPTQARQIAAQALSENNAALAAQIASVLLARNPADADAHFTLARAFGQMQHYREGRRAAVLAFRHASNDVNRFHATQLAAEMSVAENAPLRGQYWLRRSLQYSPSPQHREQVIKDYKTLRALSPWAVSGRFSLAPSSNLNNGADSPYNLIDGLPIYGILSGGAQALSGLRATADVALGYRISGSKTHKTTLTTRYIGQRVRLSEQAQLLAPTIENADLALDRLELTLKRDQSSGQGLLSYEAGIGRSWYGGAAYQSLLHLGITHSQAISPRSALHLSGRIDHRTALSGSTKPIASVDLQARISHKFAEGDQLTLGLAMRRASSDSANARVQHASGFVGYSLADPIGPATISTQLGTSLQTHPNYQVGPFAVPGGRSDKTLFGSIDLTFKGLDYAGFVPSLKVQVYKTRSNVSRYQTHETTISLGVSSSF